MSEAATPAPSARQVVARRRLQRRGLLDAAREYADRVGPDARASAVVVFGSVARGDHQEFSDVDVLVIVDRAPERMGDRLRALGWPPPPRVQPVVWTVQEWRRNVRRGEPIATEARDVGVWLLGGPEALDVPPPAAEV